MPEPELELIRADERRDLDLRYVMLCNAVILATGCTPAEAQSVVGLMVAGRIHAVGEEPFGRTCVRLLGEARGARAAVDAVIDPRD